MSSSSRFLLPLFSLFSVISLLIFFFNALLTKFGVDSYVLMAANIIFLLSNAIVFLFQYKALNHSNPNVFIRSVIAGMMLKMFVCAIAVLGYVVITGNSYNKKGVFISLFFYLIYLAAEVTILMRLNKRKNA
jgi:quinol-cytochrome oxidoreductase complex cytochrome b subunit